MKRGPWKVLSSEEVFTSPWIKVREDRIQNDQGTEGRWIVAHTWDWSSILPIDDEWNIYLIKNYLYGAWWCVDEWMTPEQTAYAELKEELWIIATSMEYISTVNPCPWQVFQCENLYIATWLIIGEQELGDMEVDIERVKLSLDEALVMARNGENMWAVHMYAYLWSSNEKR